MSAYNVEDPGSIPGSGRSPGERNGNPLQYSCPPPSPPHQKKGAQRNTCGWLHGVMVSTLDSESSDPSSNLNGTFMGFPRGSDGKASACSAGDPGSISGSGRSPGEGNGNPL